MVPALAAALAMLILTRSLARSKAAAARTQLADEPA
jgi:hypothetical protein